MVIQIKSNNTIRKINNINMRTEWYWYLIPIGVLVLIIASFWIYSDSSRFQGDFQYNDYPIEDDALFPH